MRTLLLHRRGVLFDVDWLGPALELPPEPTAASLGLRTGDLSALENPKALDAIDGAR